jgi:hypothetical protein
MKHWAARIRTPASVEEAKLLDPTIAGYADLQGIETKTIEQISGKRFDKIAAIMDIMSKQDALLQRALDRIDVEDEGGMYRIAKEIMESKLKSIQLLSRMDGDIVETNQTSINVMVQNIVPQLSGFIHNMSTQQKKVLLGQIEEKRKSKSAQEEVAVEVSVDE